MAFLLFELANPVSIPNGIVEFQKLNSQYAPYDIHHINMSENLPLIKSNSKKFIRDLHEDSPAYLLEKPRKLINYLLFIIFLLFFYYP